MAGKTNDGTTFSPLSPWVRASSPILANLYPRPMLGSYNTRTWNAEQWGRVVFDTGE